MADLPPVDTQALVEKCRTGTAYLRSNIEEAYKKFNKSGKIALRDRMFSYLELIDKQEDIIVDMEWAIMENDVDSLYILVKKFNGITTFIQLDAADVAAEARGEKPSVDKDKLH
jgi:hypothetical protein